MVPFELLAGRPEVANRPFPVEARDRRREHERASEEPAEGDREADTACQRDPPGFAEPKEFADDGDRAGNERHLVEAGEHEGHRVGGPRRRDRPEDDRRDDRPKGCETKHPDGDGDRPENKRIVDGEFGDLGDRLFVAQPRDDGVDPRFQGQEPGAGRRNRCGERFSGLVAEVSFDGGAGTGIAQAREGGTCLQSARITHVAKDPKGAPLQRRNAGGEAEGAGQLDGFRFVLGGRLFVSNLTIYDDVREERHRPPIADPPKRDRRREGDRFAGVIEERNEDLPGGSG
ncbi:hypothetical protein OUZ56_033098 [Daphnia magna]|uniref:Uncharacterized protein n=1 Tax=Daphnia magna TaxID=35525 RepID=A0ABR0BA65_9CRUS|nr:hypothetical protein OUZ56_033098 [Daphnia magna]